MSVDAEQPGSPRPRSALVIGVLVLALTAGAILAAAVTGSLWATAGPFGQAEGEVATGELIAGRRVGQTFIADEAGLYRIDVDLGNFGRQNHGPLVLHVKAAPFVAADLATATVDASELHDNSFVAFEFAPLPEPGGLPLCFWLEAPQAQPGNAVTALASKQDGYPGGAALFDQLEANGAEDLAFRLYYRPSTQQALGLLMQRQAESRPSILGLPLLYQVLFVAYLVGLAGLLVLAAVRLRP